MKTRWSRHAQNRPEGKYRGFGENPGFGDFGDPGMRPSWDFQNGGF